VKDEAERKDLPVNKKCCWKEVYCMVIVVEVGGELSGEQRYKGYFFFKTEP
jgi:hypothetical protein